MSHSTPKLSELARHLQVPSGIVSTGWPSMKVQLAELGILFDPWQEQAGKIVLGKRSDGLYAAGIGGIVWSIPRQVGKTFIVGSLGMGLCLLNPGMTVIWTAHQLRTSNETFQAMVGMARNPRVRPHVLRPRLANGEGELPFRNGSRVLFGARERGFGLGFTKVGMVVMDESQRATHKAYDDLIPTMNQHPNPLLFSIGTPPRPTDPGEAFRARRRKALAGKSRNMFYMEFGADPECVTDSWDAEHSQIDWEQVALANPSFPKRTPKAAVLRLLENLGAEAFRREGLGIWDEDSAVEPPLISSDKWGMLHAQAPAEGLVCWGVRFATDGESVALAGAVKPADGPVHVEVIDERPVMSGTQWLVDWLKPRWKTSAQIVIDGKAGAGVLAEALRSEGVGKTAILLPSVPQVITAHSMMLDHVNARKVTHSAQPGLDAQVGRAQKRPIGAHGGWGWRATNGESVTSLEAATLALWSVKTTRRRPGRGGGQIL